MVDVSQPYYLHLPKHCKRHLLSGHKIFLNQQKKSICCWFSDDQYVASENGLVDILGSKLLVTSILSEALKNNITTSKLDVDGIEKLVLIVN